MTIKRTLTSDGYSLNYKEINIDISAHEYYECGDYRCEVVYSARINGIDIYQSSLENIFQEIDERTSV